MAIPFEKDFLQMVKEKNLTEFKMKGAELDLTFEDDIEAFLNYAADRCNTIYYSFSYLPRSEVYIDGTTIEKANSDNRRMLQSLGISVDFPWFLDGDEPKEVVIKEYGDIFSDIEYLLRDQIKERNSKVNDSLLSIPIGLDACCICEGKTIGIQVKDYSQISEAGFLDSQSALSVILLNFSDKAKEMVEEQKRIREEVSNELRDYLLGDPKFQRSTNKQLRRKYAQDLWEDDRFAWIHDGFLGYDGFPDAVDDRLLDLIEYTWTEYKEMKKQH